MKNILRSALVLGALVSTPVIAMADPTPSPSTDKAPTDKADKKAPKKDAKAPAGSTDKTTTDKDQTPPPATK